MKRRNELRQLIHKHDYSIYEVKIVKEKRLCQKTHNREEAFGMDGPSLTVKKIIDNNNSYVIMIIKYKERRMTYKKKKYPIRLTPQRLAILEYLEGNNAHPSASDIYKAVSEKYPMMSFATVYNTLDTLRGKKQVLELSIDPQKKRFDPNTKPHHHLICIECRAITDVHRNFALDLTDGERCDYEITGNHVDFYGVCSKCKRKSKSKI